LSTPTETKTDFTDESVEQVAVVTPVVPETEQDGQEHQHDHTHHEHTHEDGELSPLCSGGGCVTKTSA
jgi:hypothetical protein